MLLRIALIVLFAFQGAARGVQPPADAPARPKQVLAFYYPWYGRPDGPGGYGKWVHWEGVDERAKRIGSSTNFPTLGAYDSHDPAAIAAHAAMAKDAGIDGFILSWWGEETFEDRATPVMLDVLGQHGMTACIYYEKLPRGGSARDVRDDLMNVLRWYASHAAWLRVDGRPVVFVYGRAVNDLGLDGWREVVRLLEREGAARPFLLGDHVSAEAAAIFDGLHVYTPAADIPRDVPSKFPTVEAWAANACRFWVGTAREARRLSTATVMPGYDDTKVRTPGLRVDRAGGGLYRALWRAAIDADPDWVLICSFNEWHEGSEIEQSEEYGRAYIEMTREFSEAFRAGASGR